MIPMIAMQAVAGAPLTVDMANGGLEGAAMVLSERHGVGVTFEESSPSWCGDLVDMPDPHPDRPPESKSPHPYWEYVHRTLTFRYDGGAREALEAAVAAWKASGGNGDYQIVDANGLLHLVPTTRKMDDCQVVPFVSPLDRVVTLATATGTPNELWAAIVAATSTPDLPVTDGSDRAQIGPGNQHVPLTGADVTPDQLATLRKLMGPDLTPDAAAEELEAAYSPPDGRITLSTTRGKARDLLDEVTRLAGASYWVMGCGPFLPDGGTRCWVASRMSQVEDEYSYNRTPVFPAPPPPEPAPLPPVPAHP